MSLRYESNSLDYSNLPGSIFAYWLSKPMLMNFKKDKRLYEHGQSRQGLSTSDNNRFLRFWYEVSVASIGFSCASCQETTEIPRKWFPYNKAGHYQKWSCINEYVVNYQDDGSEIKKEVMRKYPYLKTPDFVVKNTDFYFKSGITWNDVATDNFCARMVPNGYIFADAGPMFFTSNSLVKLGYFNSKPFQQFADVICQGLHYSTGHISEIPYLPVNDDEKSQEIKRLVKTNIEFSSRNRDSFETAWGFEQHPLI